MTTPSNPAIQLFATEQRARLDRASSAAALLMSSVRFAMRMPGHLRRAMRAWNGRLNDRRYLAGLKEFQVHEMGLTLAERDHEVQKPFWEA